MFLKHFGIVVGGETIEEAFFLAENMMTACETQVSCCLSVITCYLLCSY